MIKKLFLIAVSLSFILGCAESPQVRKPEEPTNIVWPRPPEKPRIKYIRSYSDTFDVEDLPGFFDQIAGVKYFNLNAPQGIVADREGNIYAADSIQGVVAVFKPDKKKLEFIGRAEIGERVSLPIGLAIAEKNNMLLVASTGSKKVIGYDLSNYKKIRLIIEGFKNPVSLAVDETRNRIYVTDSKASELLVFDMSGKYIATFAKKGGADDQLAAPNQVAVDKQGNIYIADIFNYKIKVFSPEGKFLKSFGHGPCTGFGCFSKVNGVAIDSDNNIYAVDIDFSNVQIFNQQGDVLLSFAGFGGRNTHGMLQMPMHIYIDDKDRIYIADTFNLRINVYQYIKYPDEK